MKKLWSRALCMIFVVGCLCSNRGYAETALVFTDEKDTGYKPGVTYAGEFIQTKLYYRNPHSAVWRWVSASDKYLEVVRCSTALAALETTGTWKGHLMQDGSCGPVEEPSYFALGNRINYDILMEQDVSSK